MTREEAKREILFAKREVMADSWIDKAYDVVIKALEQPEQRWIPVTERLPEKSGNYLTSTYYHEVYCDYWNPYEGTWNRTEQILAWCELPEPYKDDPCNGCGYLGESCVGEGCGKLAERKEDEEGEADD